MKTFKYNVFGLNIESEIELPELITKNFMDSDVFIKFGKVPRKLKKPLTKSILYEAQKNDFLFILESAGAFRAQNGNLITIEQHSNNNLDETRLFLLGSVMGALLMQRGLMPIHGSSVVTSSGITVIMGQSTSGKSSLAAALSSLGYSILSDDITAISKDVNDQYQIYPGIPHIKLWKDVLDYFNEEQALSKVRSQIEKYKKPIEVKHTNGPFKLSNFIFLTAKNINNYNIYEQKGVDKFNSLKSNTFRFQYIEGLDLKESHFTEISKIASKYEVHMVERPRSPLKILELAQYLIEQSLISHVK